MEQDVYDFVKAFVSIIWEAFPFVVLGAIIAGVLEEVVPQQAISKLIPKNPLLAVCIGALLGLVLEGQDAREKRGGSGHRGPFRRHADVAVVEEIRA